jgi:hypothetical protein
MARYGVHRTGSGADFGDRNYRSCNGLSSRMRIHGVGRHHNWINTKLGRRGVRTDACELYFKKIHR